MRLTKILAVLVAFACCNAAIAQNLTVKGKVINEATQKALQSATVSLVGAKKGTATDAQGNFTIKLPDDSKEYQLTIVFTGFVTKKISVKAGDNVTVALKEDIKDEGEVMVQTSYGNPIKKKEAIASLSTVGAKDLKDIPVTNIGEALNGRLAGVTATSAEGSPDAQITIKVRGGGSITGDNSPLYVVDGVIVENGLSNIALQDVQDITVLKDAAATAIYGARGANGVIVITTKSGKSGKLRVTYNTYVAFKTLPKTLDVLGPYDFVMNQYERAISVNGLSTFRTNYGSTWDTLENYTQAAPVNWQKKVMALSGFSQQHNIGLSGGNKKTNYYGSYTYQNDKNIVINSGLNKNLLNFRVEHKLAEKIRIGGTARYLNQNVYGVGTSSVGSTTENASFSRLRQSIKYRPYLKPGETPDDVNDDYPDPGNGLLLINPIKLANNEYRKQTTNNLNLSFNVVYTINSHLSFKSTIGYETSLLQDRQFSDSLTPYSFSQNGKKPILEFDSTKKVSFTNSNVLIYSLKNFHNKHDIDALLGEETTDLSTTINGNLYTNIPRGLGADASVHASLNDSIQATGYPTIIKRRATLASFFGQLKYSYDKKYMFSFILRADGSSKFAPEQRWGYFPSASVGWRVSNEKFFKVKFINDLKLRASYGENGNARIDDYLYFTTFANLNSGGTPVYYGIGNQPITAYIPSGLVNEKLKWESLISQNVGFDITLFKKRLEISMDYYTNHSSDLLLNVPIADTYGYSTQQQNIGKTTNKGVEIQVNAAIIQKRNGFNWNANFNISFNKNEITALGRNMQYFSPAASWAPKPNPSDYIEQIGSPVGSMYGFVTDGFYTTNDFLPYDFSKGLYPLKPGVVISSLQSSTRPVQPGDIKFKDLDGNDTINFSDRKIIGNPTPKFTGGINQQFSYKNFDASVFINFSYGGQIYNANKIENTNNYTPNANLLSVMSDRFRTIDNSGNLITDINQLAAVNSNAKIWKPTHDGTDFLTHSWAIEDGSFIRINNITVGYSLPLKSLARLHISKLRIYITGNNLKVFTKYTGYDPEVSVGKNPLTPNLDYSAYPKSRSIIFGINVGF